MHIQRLIPDPRRMHKNVIWKMQQEGKFKHCDQNATQIQNCSNSQNWKSKLLRQNQVLEEEAATEKAEDIAQALERTYAGTVETHGILDTKQNVKQWTRVLQVPQIRVSCSHV